MADLQAALAEAVKLNQHISQFLKFSTYPEYNDLSGLDIDFHDGEQVLSCGVSRNGWRMCRNTFPI